MDLLQSLIILSEKAANIARAIRENQHLFKLLIEEKKENEANPRFVKDFKTLADVLIQETVKHFIGKQFSGEIRGEESNVFSNTLGESIRVEVKENANETANLLKIILNNDEKAANLLAIEIHKNIKIEQININKQPLKNYNINFNNLGIWIDPIDSTAEYINGIEKTTPNGIYQSGLRCVTVLIGVYDTDTGLPIIGVINQPFSKQTHMGWEGECFWGVVDHNNVTDSSLPPSNTIQTNIIFISGSENEEIQNHLKDQGFELVEVAGAGYKILSVIKGQGDAYVLTKNSTFKWDTCGPHAILRALGGDIVCYNNSKNTLKYNDEIKENTGGIVAYNNVNVLLKIFQ